MQIKSLFISDIHLGSKFASTKKLLDFLSIVKEHPPEKIYIIGDFIDGWKLKRNWYWTNESTLLIRKLLTFLKKGTEIYYIAGNHDEFIREFIQDFHIEQFGSIYFGNEFVHETADGKKLLVTHGDLFDLVTRNARWLSMLGDIGYDLLLTLNKFIVALRKMFRMSHWSLSKAVKSNIKQAVNFISSFEKCLEDHAVKMNCDGCICGHIHTPALKTTDGFIYANSGDWVESCTAIYEDYEGQLHLYYHK